MGIFIMEDTAAAVANLINRTTVEGHQKPSIAMRRLLVLLKLHSPKSHGFSYAIKT